MVPYKRVYPQCSQTLDTARPWIFVNWRLDFVLLEFILEETVQELYKPFIHIIARFFLYVEVLYYFGEQFAAGGCCYWGLLVSPAFGSFLPTGIAASSSLLSAALSSYFRSSMGSSREATVCFNSFISFITDLNITGKPLNGLANPRPGRSHLSLPCYFVASNYVGALVLVLLNYQLRWCDILFSTAQ